MASLNRMAKRFERTSEPLREHKGAVIEYKILLRDVEYKIVMHDYAGLDRLGSELVDAARKVECSSGYEPSLRVLSYYRMAKSLRIARMASSLERSPPDKLRERLNGMPSLASKSRPYSDTFLKEFREWLSRMPSPAADESENQNE